jgi:hypothetical protein
MLWIWPLGLYSQDFILFITYVHFQLSVIQHSSLLGPFISYEKIKYCEYEQCLVSVLKFVINFSLINLSFLLSLVHLDLKPINLLLITSFICNGIVPSTFRINSIFSVLINSIELGLNVSASPKPKCINKSVLN